MPKSPSRPAFLPLIAAALGLALGLLGQGLVRPSSPSSSTPGPASSSAPIPTPGRRAPTAAFLQSTPSLTLSECEEQVRQVLGTNEPNLEIKLEAVFRRWLGLATAEEILGVLDDDPALSRSRLLKPAFFHAWVAVDEAAAMVPGDRPEFSAERVLFAIEHDYPNFVDYLLDHTGLDSAHSHALTDLARRNPELARTIAELAPGVDGKSHALAAVARGLAANDPQGALAWLDSLALARSLSQGSRIAIFSEWARSDPSAASEAVAAYRDLPGAKPFPSRGRLPAFLTKPSNPTSQLDLARFKDPFLDVASLHQHLVEAEIDWTAPSFPFPAINKDGWYSPDPERDALAAAQLPPGEARDFIIKAICHNWAGHDPEAARRFAESHGVSSSYLERKRVAPPDEERAAAFAVPEQAFAALFNREEGVDYSKLSRFAEEWAAADPVAAAEWLVTQEYDPDSLDLAERFNSNLFSNTLGYHWARQDPIGAARWVESLSEGPVRSRAWATMRDSVTSYAPDLAFSLSAAWLEGPSRLGHLEDSLQAVRKSIGQPAALSLLKNSADLSEVEASALAESLRAATNNSSR